VRRPPLTNLSREGERLQHERRTNKMAVYMITSETLYRMHQLKREMAGKKRRPNWIWAAVIAWAALLFIVGR
jgi:hypothetical protein